MIPPSYITNNCPLVASLFTAARPPPLRSLQARHRNEVGGMLFCLVLASTVAIGLAPVYTMDQLEGVVTREIVARIMIASCAGKQFVH